jgi:hypothetical protein
MAFADNPGLRDQVTACFAKYLEYNATVSWCLTAQVGPIGSREELVGDQIVIAPTVPNTEIANHEINEWLCHDIENILYQEMENKRHTALLNTQNDSESSDNDTNADDFTQVDKNKKKNQASLMFAKHVHESARALHAHALERVRNTRPTSASTCLYTKLLKNLSAMKLTNVIHSRLDGDGDHFSARTYFPTGENYTLHFYGHLLQSESGRVSRISVHTITALRVGDLPENAFIIATF